MRNNPPVEEIITMTINSVLIRMTEINKHYRYSLYKEFKEWILNSGETSINQDVLCLRYLKNHRRNN